LTIYSIDQAYVAYAIGTDLTAWRNGDAALVVGELQALDNLDANAGVFGVDYSDPIVEEINTMSASQYPQQQLIGFKTAALALPMYLQSGVPLYATLGGCTTTGSYTHTMSLASSQTPISFAAHFKKIMSSQNIEYDFLGFMPDSWRLTCGDDPGRWVARQVLMTKFALSQSSAGDIAEPSKMTLSKYEWSDLQHASGALTAKYDGTDLEFEIKGVDAFIKRTKPLWGARDADGFPGTASIAGIQGIIKLDGYLSGDNVRTVMATKPASYAGDLDVVIKFYKSATRYYQITLDKMYLKPDKDILNETDWYEKKTLEFYFMGSSSSIVPIVVDTLDKTYYEND